MDFINRDNYLITILGPTASGKTSVAVGLAKSIEGEVISADSRQVYKGMDLGTGKDIDDYTIDGVSIRSHLIDICKAGEKYNLFEYQKDFYKVYEDIVTRKKIPILCGGTGLYIEAATKGYEMKAVPPDNNLREELVGKSMEELMLILESYKSLHNTSDFDTKKRAIRAIEIEKYQTENNIEINYPKVNPIYFGVKFERTTQRERITMRLKQRFDDGMLDEVKMLLEKGIQPEDLIYYGLEYKFMTMHLIGEISYNEMFSRLNTAIHQFAKRQMTWYRRMERNGETIYWLEGNDSASKKQEEISKVLEKYKKKI